MTQIKQKSGLPPAKQSIAHNSVFGCLYAGSSPGFFNGLQRANCDFLKALIRYSRFREIHIFCETTSLNTVKDSLANFINTFGNDKKILFIPAHQLYQYFTNTQYEAFHQGDPYIGHLASLRDAYCSSPFPLTGRAHTLSTDSHLSRSRDLLLSPLKSCDAIICSSKAQKTVMKRLLSAASANITNYIGIAIPYKGLVELLPLGVEPDDASQEIKSHSREQLGFCQNTSVILVLGRIAPADKMDLHPLLLVINELVEQHNISDCLMVIAGSGDASDSNVMSLLQQAYALNLETKIRFELSVDDKRKALLLSACDIFVSLADNIQESFGLAPLEAMIHGVPVVLSDWNGYSELIEDGVSGFLIPTLSANHDKLSRPAGFLLSSQAHFIQAQGTAVDLDRCAKIIRDLLTDDNLLQRVGESGRERVLNNFCWEQVVDGYHQLILKLKKEAEGLSCASGRSVGLPYHQVFSHYPSDQISDDQILTSTDRGIRVLLNSEPSFFYSELKELLHPEFIEQLIDDCISGASLGQLKQKYSNSTYEPNKLVFTILWMCKYQLLKNAPPEQNSTTALKSTYSLPEPQTLSRELLSYMHRIEAHRFKLISSVISWFDQQVTLTHGQSENFHLRADLLNHLAANLDEQLVQAIGWISDRLGTTVYSDVLDHINVNGGISYLFHIFPQWYRLNKRFVLRMLRDMKIMFKRFKNDLADINNLFQNIWNQPAKEIIRIHIPDTTNQNSTVLLDLNNGQKLTYKNRDLRFDELVLGFSEEHCNIAESVNRWLSDSPGIETHRILPREDQGRYGYTEYIDSHDNQILDDKQAKNYYQQLGVISSLALVLGIEDLNHKNLISSQGKLHLLDIKHGLSPRMLRACESELKNSMTGFARGMDDCSLQKSGVKYIIESFHSYKLKASSYLLTDGEVRTSPTEVCSLHSENLIRVGERTNQDAIQPPLASTYSNYIELGMKSVINIISEHSDEWTALLMKSKGMHVIHKPYIDFNNLAWQRNALFTYKGFQTFSSRRLKEYFTRIAIRLCMGGDETQRWLEPEWKEACGQIHSRVSEAILFGHVPYFTRELGSSSLMVHTPNTQKIELAKENYFSCDTLNRAIRLVKEMSESPASRDTFLTTMTLIFKQWLHDKLQPGSSLPEPLKEPNKNQNIDNS